MLKKAALIIAVGLTLTTAAFIVIYLRDIRRHHHRVAARGVVIPSPYGNIEYTEGGQGPDVLVIHGAGGGWDQGELMVRVALGNEFHWIAPSRFGYLRSAIPVGAAWDDQAHAYAFLLDRLGIKKVAVVALSQGGPSALLFAVLHPDRVSSLTLISCGVAASESAAQAEANQRGNALRYIFQSDLPYWTISKLFEKQLMGLMGANEEVIAGLTPEQMAEVGRLIDEMNPVSLRAAGVIMDNTATMPGKRIAAITAPTLIFHAEDDGLQLFHNAEFAAAHIPGARLMRFKKGGHLLLCVEQAAIRPALHRHIIENAR